MSAAVPTLKPRYQLVRYAVNRWGEGAGSLSRHSRYSDLPSAITGAEERATADHMGASVQWAVIDTENQDRTVHKVAR